MCGIVGAISSRPDRQAVERMREALAYRGPDQHGEYFQDSIALGFRRLSIIDLSTGSQPMMSADGRHVIIFNGEIYNYQELRPALENKYKFRTKSDTEVLLYHLIEHGSAGLEDLNGMFALALWDTKEQKLLLARDRFGKKPLYYTKTNDAFVFASEIKSLFAYPGVSKDLDRTAIARYFLFEYTPSPDTPFTYIKKLPAGAYLQFSTQNPEPVIKQWWKLENLNTPEVSKRLLGGGEAGSSRSQNLARLDELLNNAVKYRMIADVPVGVLLSGGIDSSTIAYYMRKHTEKLHSFSVSFSEESFNEGSYAQAAARHLGTIHHNVHFGLPEFYNTLDMIRERLDEPLADASLLPTFLVSQAAKEHVTVTLDGDGADELLYGYDTFPAYQLARLLGPLGNMLQTFSSILPTSYKNFSLDFKLKSFLRGLPYENLIRNQVWLGSFHDKELEALLAPDWQIKAKELYQPMTEISQRFSSVTPLQKLSADYLAHYLQDDILTKLDRASMYASLESRTPFLDPVLASFLFQLPDNQKMQGCKTKIILKNLMRGKLPDEIIDRPKKGFGIPLGQWLRGPLKNLLQETLSPENIKKAGVCQVSSVKSLIASHLSGRSDNRKKLWTLMIFHWWYQKWAT